MGPRDGPLQSVSNAVMQRYHSTQLQHVHLQAARVGKSGMLVAPAVSYFVSMLTHRGSPCISLVLSSYTLKKGKLMSW